MSYDLFNFFFFSIYITDAAKAYDTFIRYFGLIQYNIYLLLMFWNVERSMNP